MDKLNRLKLLSNEDSSPLNVGGPSLPLSSDLSHASTNLIETESDLRQTPGKSDTSFDDFSVACSYLNSTVTAEASKIPTNTAQVYCPIQAISRLPYRRFKGDLAPLIAKKFFEDGKFWERTWTL
jgi:hypothetical protein